MRNTPFLMMGFSLASSSTSMSVATGFQRALKTLKQKHMKPKCCEVVFGRDLGDNVEPVEALGQHPLVVKAKESGESENDDNEADCDDDDHNVVRLLNFSFVPGLSAGVAVFLRVLGTRISGRSRRRK